MATNSEILKLLETIANGEGIAGIKSDLQGLKEDMIEVKSELKEIKDAGFHDDSSLKSRLVLLEKSVENIKLYELKPIKERYEKSKDTKNTLATKVIGAVLVVVVLWILANSFGISA